MGHGVGKEPPLKRKSSSDTGEVGELDDDERPIGSLFKLKKSRQVGKKVKESIKEDGAKKDEVLEDGDSGEMDDTLASLRKKLKAPKRVTVAGWSDGSGAERGKDCSVLGGEALLDQMQDVEDPQKLRKRTSRVPSLENNGKGEILSPPESPGHSSDEDLKDSLLAFVRKAQLGLVRSSSIRKKQMVGSSNSSEELKQSVDDVRKSHLFDVVGRTPSSEHEVETNPTEVGASVDQHSYRVSSDLETLDERSCATKRNVAHRGRLRSQKPIDELGFNSSQSQKDCILESVQESSSVSGIESGEESTRPDDDGSGRSSEEKASILGGDEQLEPSTKNPKQFMPFFNQNISPKSIQKHIESISHSGNELVQQHDGSMEESSWIASAEKETNGACSKVVDQPSKICTKDYSSIAVTDSYITRVITPKKEVIISDEEQFKSSDCISPIMPSEEAKQHIFASDFSGHYPAGISLTNEKYDNSNKKPSHVPVYEHCAVETTRIESLSLVGDVKETHAVDVIATSDAVTKDKNQNLIPRATRRVKRHRHGDMAYEGDADWEILMHDQGPFENVITINGERSTRTRDKLDSQKNLILDAQDGIVAAVAAGLKARAASPIEKIKFKDVFKRKGGLQEYIECRNSILGLWSKDVRRILTIEDCGVTAIPSENEPLRVSLIRQIYSFLDSSGYINAGIASDKKMVYGGLHAVLPEETTPNETSIGHIVDAKDEPSYLPHQDIVSNTVSVATDSVEFKDVGTTTVFNTEAIATDSVDFKDVETTTMFNAEAKCEIFPVPGTGRGISTQIASGEHKVVNVKLDMQPISPVSVKQQLVSENIGKELSCDLDVPTRNVSSDLIVGVQGVDCQSLQARNEILTVDVKPGSSLNTVNSINSPFLSPKNMDLSPNEYQFSGSVRDNVTPVDSVVFDSATDHGTHCDIEEVHKKIIIIGAGPAGLTAARHLQRQGFSVTVLEARDRIGGRVYTDRSSLSAPVDLGASIITGVEADIATERRPDPSSLICAQLGLELTVLNSDCPLYDIVTGQKVPADLDEALEEEYNSILDNIDVLITQNGDAIGTSLEEGLEYALKTHHIAQSTSSTMVSPHSKIVDETRDLESLESASVFVGDVDNKVGDRHDAVEDVLSPIERRVMNWHFAHLEYGCAASLKDVSLVHWNQDDIYGGFGGAHCMIKGGFSSVLETLGKGLTVLLNHVVTEIAYNRRESSNGLKHSEVKVTTSDGSQFVGDAVLVTVPLGCLKADTIKFSPALPDWKHSSIQCLGFGVLNKVVLEFPEVFWDDSVDYFGATAEETCRRGQCFMFWNVKKTVGAPVLIALVVGKAAVEGQNSSTSDHVNHALKILRKLFGEASVPDPVASVVTNWGMDPYSRGAYSYVAVGASGEDYDILGRPVENCLFFAGEATCKEHPDTVGGAMLSGLREAVRMIDIFNTGNDYTAEVEAMEVAQRQADNERNEVRDLVKRLDSHRLPNVLAKNYLGGMLQDMFCNAKTTAGRLHLAKELLRLPVEALKSFAGTKEGLTILNSWILDSMGKDATQLLRHCVRLLVLVSTDLLAVRLSGIGKTVKDKVCVHTSRDIRAIASQLVNVWIEVFRKEKAANGALKLLRQTTVSDSSKNKPKDQSSGKPPLGTSIDALIKRGNLKVSSSSGNQSPPNSSSRKVESRTCKVEPVVCSKLEALSPCSQSIHGLDAKVKDSVMSAEEAAAFAAAEAASAAALAAAEAYEAERSKLPELPKIPSFHKFARREQYAQMDDLDRRKKWPGGILGRQDCLSEIDSRNCRVRDWSVDFSAARDNLDGSRMPADKYSHWNFPNESAFPLNFREHSGDSGAVDSRLKKAWVDTDSAGSGGVKDYAAIERWQSQAMDADADFFNSMHMRDEEDSNKTKSPVGKYQRQRGGSCASQATESVSLSEGRQPRGVENIKQGVVDYVASLLMPLYKTRKIDKDQYKSIMKKSATKVMELCTEAEKAMTVSEFLDFRRKNKIRAFVDKLIERHLAMYPNVKV